MKYCVLKPGALCFCGLPPKLLMTMKLVMLILFTCLMQVSASTLAQRITLSEKNTSLEQVLRKVKSQIGYEILFASDVLDEAKNVTVNFSDVALKEGLDEIFENQPLTYELRDNTIIVRRKAPSFLDRVVATISNDDRNLADIRGVVRNEKGEALEGITVMVKGSKTGTRTNAKGEFLLKGVKKGDVLVFTGVAIEPFEYTVKDDKNIDLNLKARLVQLEEVNVEYNTGYQKIPKERATGSFVFIDSAIINRSVSPNIIDRLEGLTPGLLVDRRDKNNPPRLQIRGIYSLDATAAAPLIVLNGFPYDGDINNINPNDIANITILRDAAAASIWGARAGNGVIVITTKDGQFNRKMQASYRNTVNITEKTRLFTMPILSTSDLIDVEKFLFEKGKFDGDLSTDFMPVTKVTQILDDQRKGKITVDLANEKIDALRGIDHRNDFLKYVYRNPIAQQYAANVNGGSENMKYFFSVGYDRSLPQLIGDNNSRLSLNLGNTFKLSKKIELGISANYTYNKTKAMQTNTPTFGALRLGSGIKLPKYYRLINENGKPEGVEISYRQEFLDNLEKGGLLDWKYRPLEELNLADNRSHSKQLNANLNLRYALSEAFNIDLGYQLLQANSLAKNKQDQESYFTRELINAFTNLNETSVSKRYPVPLGSIVDQTYSELLAHNARIQLNFNKTWSRIHALNIIAGTDVRQVVTSSKMDRIYGYDEEILSSALVDLVNPYPVLPFGGEGIIPSNYRETGKEDRFVAAFSNASYTFQNKYTVSGSVRKDASNLFGVKTNSKGSAFFSIGTSWNISREQFYAFAWMPNLTLKATFGYSGNVNRASVAVPVITIGPAEANPILNLPFAVLQGIPNSNLRWEKIATFNIGLDFSFKNDFLLGSIDYYRKKSTDVVDSYPGDISTGQGVLRANMANLSGGGLDISLKSKNINSLAFKWNSSITLSIQRNKVIKSLNPVYTNLRGHTSDGGSIEPIVGIRPFSLISYRWAGLSPVNGNPRGYFEGEVSENYIGISTNPIEQQKIHGSGVPLYFGNFSNILSYKNLSISWNITYKLGYYFRKPVFSYSQLFSSLNGNQEYLERWQKTGDEKTTNIPSMQYPANSRAELFYPRSEVNVERGDHIRLNDINLNYTLSSKILSKFKLRSLGIQAGISSLNLMIWKANNADLDPENLSMKSSRSLMLGFNLGF